MNRLLGKMLLLSIALLWTPSVFCAPQFLFANDDKISLELEALKVVSETDDIKSLYKNLSSSTASTSLLESYSSNPIAFMFRATNHSGHHNWVLRANAAGIYRVRVLKVVPSPQDISFVPQLIDRPRVISADLDLNPGETARFLVIYHNYDNLGFGFSIWDQSQAIHTLTNESGWIGVATGIMLAVIIYNGFLYLSLRQSFHLYYLLFAVTNGLIAIFSMNFPEGMWTWIYQADKMDWVTYLRPLAPITTMMFTSVFLELKLKHPNFHRSFIAYYMGLGLIAAYFTITGKPTEMNAVLDPFFILAIFMMTGAGIHAYRKGYTPAKYYLLGLTVFFLGIFISIVFPPVAEKPNVFLVTSHLWGQAAEMLLMSLALASQIKILTDDKLRAEVSAETKSRLLRVISHDIRNPLAIIKGYSNILSQRMPDEVNIQKILRSANVIQEITGLVQRTETERKSGTKELAPASIRSVFDELAFLFHRSALNKNIHLNFVVHPEDLQVIADETILTNEILANLITNAIKFSFSGSSVEVKAFAYGEKVRISVKDRGIGIPKGALSKIFDKEANFSRRGTSGELGAGFGLPIVYSYVQEFKGRIEVTSTAFEVNDDQRGTEFIITLRRANSLTSEV